MSYDYIQSFDVTYKKIEIERRSDGSLPENFVRIGQAFESQRRIITVRIDAMPIGAFWPSRKLILFPKNIFEDTEDNLSDPLPTSSEGTLVEVREVAPGSFFRRPQGRVVYMRIGKSLDYPFKLKDIVFGVNRKGSAIKLDPDTSVVISSLDEFLEKDVEK